MPFRTPSNVSDGLIRSLGTICATSQGLKQVLVYKSPLVSHISKVRSSFDLKNKSFLLARREVECEPAEGFSR